MQRSNFVIPNLDSASLALDLSVSLNAVSGVSHVDVDQSTGTLTVDYDPAYLSVESLKEFIKGTGYPYVENEHAR